MNDVELAYAIARLYRESTGWTMNEMASRIVRESGRSEGVVIMMIHAIDAYVDES